jgi:hypothetical protein
MTHFCTGGIGYCFSCTNSQESATLVLLGGPEQGLFQVPPFSPTMTPKCHERN